MKVLLAATPVNRESFNFTGISLVEPLGLEYLAAGIRENHDVKFVELRLEVEPPLEQVLETFQPDIIGLGASTPDVYTALELFAEAKKIRPGILTVVGGHHVSVSPSDFFNENVDVIVMGEGVHPFKKICDYHEKQKDFGDIENIYYRENGSKEAKGKMVFTYKAPFPDLDSFPFPARDVTSHIRQHYKTRMLYTPMRCALVRSSCGCIYGCKFCPIWKMMGRKLHTRSIANVIEEIAALEEELFIWVDDEFLLDAQRTISLAGEIEKAGINKSHYFLGRSDTIVKHPECIEAWAKIGLKSCYVGLESHREKDLKSIKKGFSLSTNKEAIRILQENGVIVRGGFIIQPDFEKDDFRKIADYALELNVDFPSYSIYTPIPGTDLWEETKDTFVTHNLNLFDMVHTVVPTALPLKDFYKEYSDLLFKKGIPSQTRKKLFKQIKLKDRWKLLRNGMKLYKGVKNSYRLHQA
jgi:radical SAM superfamily enzyme YgiQ (UPF0313 family)